MCASLELFVWQEKDQFKKIDFISVGTCNPALCLSPSEALILSAAVCVSSPPAVIRGHFTVQL